MGKGCPWILVCHVKSTGKFYPIMSVSPRPSHFQNISPSLSFSYLWNTVQYSYTTYRLSWFVSDLLLLQTFVWPASTPPLTHTAPDIRTTVCFLDTPYAFTLLYLDKCWFLLPKWFPTYFQVKSHICVKDPSSLWGFIAF